jgi:hypothetical protein
MHLLIGTRLGLGDGGASWRTQRFDLIYVLSELIMSVPSYSCVMFIFFIFYFFFFVYVVPFMRKCAGASAFWRGNVGLIRIVSDSFLGGS